jgi:8-hydroxy-5-deazaflavin:NADPH oxidoreductase
MRVTIVGAGNMARAISARLLDGDHHVNFVGTSLAKAEAIAEEMAGAGSTSAGETVDGDVVVLAVPYTAATHVVRQHADALPGMVVVDPTNPVDVATMDPIRVELGSAAETIAAEVPDGVPVVKAFNTTLAGPLLAGQVAGIPLDVLLAGDDSSAKATVAQLVSDGGQRPIDVGELARARELEATGYVHMRVQAPLGTFFDTSLKVLTPRDGAAGGGR